MAASFGLVYFPSTFLHPSNSHTHQFLCPASPFSLSTSNVLSQRFQRPKRSNFYLFHVAESQMVQDNNDDDDDSSDSRLLAQNGTGAEIERVINCKVEADDVKKHNNAGDGFQLQVHRRDILYCFGAIVTMDLIARSTSFIQVANAADLIQRRQRSEFQSAIKGTLAKLLKENPDLVPSVLTLALNDAITYDKATKSGGPNGSIRLSLEISRPENSGHAAALRLLDQVKGEIDSYSKGGPISYADLIQLAAQSAVKSTFLASAIRKCGGNEEKGSLLYTAYGSTGQWGLFDKQFGRSDAQEPDPEGRVPQWEKASVEEMKAKFTAVGLGPRQLAVMSAFLGPDQAATEKLLSSDPEVAKWVEKYQRSRETVSQTDYEVDLITTLTKLSSLGQQINYEAYTYPVKKVDFSKLKL